jgi:hypothetical protein
MTAQQEGIRPGPGALLPMLVRAFMALRLLALIPIPIAVAMFVFAPTYTRPMVGSGLGIAILVLAVGFVAGGYALTAAAVRFVRSRRIGVGLLLALVSVFFCTFPALWLVLIGPAAVILIQKQ